MPALRNINPLGDVDLPLLGRTIAAGEVFEVTASIAGRAPSVSQDEDGNDVVDPGEGLLAQTSNYELADGPSSRGPSVKDLQTELKERGLKTTGKKDDLIARLATADAPPVAPPAPADVVEDPPPEEQGDHGEPSDSSD